MISSREHVRHLADMDALTLAPVLSAGRDPGPMVAKLWRRACIDAALDANERTRWADLYRRIVLFRARRLVAGKGA
jgi:hypothetical protein